MLGHLDFNVLSTLKLNGFVRNEIVTDTWLRAYRAPFPSPDYAAGAIGWAKGLAIGAHEFEQPGEDALREIQKKPALAIWGEEDKTLGARHFIPLFEQLFPDAPVHFLSDAGHYTTEDAPGDVTLLVKQFIETHQ